MTSDELQTAKVLLVAAFQQQRDAAEAWTRAVEYAVALTGGDPEIVHSARANQCRIEKLANSGINAVREGDMDGLVETFK